MYKYIYNFEGKNMKLVVKICIYICKIWNETKNSLSELKSKLHAAKEKISDLEDTAVKNDPSRSIRRDRMKGRKRKKTSVTYRTTLREVTQVLKSPIILSNTLRRESEKRVERYLNK